MLSALPSYSRKTTAPASTSPPPPYSPMASGSDVQSSMVAYDKEIERLREQRIAINGELKVLKKQLDKARMREFYIV